MTKEYLKNTLKKLNINYDDVAQVSDGACGYLLALVSNLNENDEVKLRKLGLSKTRDDLWCMYVEG